MQIKTIIEKHESLPKNLIQILLDYQLSKNSKCISSYEVEKIAEEMNIPASKVYSVVEFYSFFSTTPRGRYIIQVCNDIPCYVNGSFDMIRELEKQLEIKMGETTDDRMFSIERTGCIGCCNASPAFRIGEETYGNLDSEKISQIISFYRTL